MSSLLLPILIRKSGNASEPTLFGNRDRFRAVDFPLQSSYSLNPQHGNPAGPAVPAFDSACQAAGVQMKLAILIALGVLILGGPRDAAALGQERYVLEKSAAGAFPLVQSGKAAGIFVDSADWPGVARAAADLQQDIHRVTGIDAAIVKDLQSPPANLIIVGTIGKSPLID